MRVIFLLMIVFSLKASDAFIDTKTGLIWQDNSEAKNISKDWNAAKEYCKNLKLGGKSDWRLPSIKELQSIVDITKLKFNRSASVIRSGFENTASGFYWSSSQRVSVSSDAWVVDFSIGTTRRYPKSHRLYVRCVRNKQSL